MNPKIIIILLLNPKILRKSQKIKNYMSPKIIILFSNQKITKVINMTKKIVKININQKIILIINMSLGMININMSQKIIKII